MDGGTIRAAKDSERLIRSANNLYVTVGANGGTIDAAGYNVTIEEDLDNASGATGKMTFKGGGTVTLSGAINYTGGTTVEAGTVVGDDYGYGTREQYLRGRETFRRGDV